MRVLTEGLIRVSEEDAVNSGAFSFRELMYRAGKSAADVIMQRFPVCGKKVAVLCGKGNNGGDGFVIADILSQNGADVTVITPMGLPATENAKYYYDRLNAAVFGNETDIEKSDLIIDALFGIGLNRAPSETVKKIINIAKCRPLPPCFGGYSERGYDRQRLCTRGSDICRFNRYVYSLKALLFAAARL